MNFWKRFDKKEKAMIFGATVVVAGCLYLLSNEQILFSGSSSDGVDIATVKEQRNDTRYRAKDNLTWYPAQTSQKIKMGDSLFSGKKSAARIEMVKGGEVQMGENSLITFRQVKNFQIADLSGGAFKLKLDGNVKLSMGGKVTEIEGKQSVVQVVVDSDQETKVRLLKGEAEIKKEDKSSEKLKTRKVAYVSGKQTGPEDEGKARAEALEMEKIAAAEAASAYEAAAAKAREAARVKAKAIEAVVIEKTALAEADPRERAAREAKLVEQKIAAEKAAAEEKAAREEAEEIERSELEEMAELEKAALAEAAQVEAAKQKELAALEIAARQKAEALSRAEKEAIAAREKVKADRERLVEVIKREVLTGRQENDARGKYDAAVESLKNAKTPQEKATWEKAVADAGTAYEDAVKLHEQASRDKAEALERIAKGDSEALAKASELAKAAIEDADAREKAARLAKESQEKAAAIEKEATLARATREQALAKQKAEEEQATARENKEREEAAARAAKAAEEKAAALENAVANATSPDEAIARKQSAALARAAQVEAKAHADALAKEKSEALAKAAKEEAAARAKAEALAKAEREAAASRNRAKEEESAASQKKAKEEETARELASAQEKANAIAKISQAEVEAHQKLAEAKAILKQKVAAEATAARDLVGAHDKISALMRAPRSAANEMAFNQAKLDETDAKTRFETAGREKKEAQAEVERLAALANQKSMARSDLGQDESLIFQRAVNLAKAAREEAEKVEKSAALAKASREETQKILKSSPPVPPRATASEKVAGSDLPFNMNPSTSATPSSGAQPATTLPPQPMTNDKVPSSMVSQKIVGYTWKFSDIYEQKDNQLFERVQKPSLVDATVDLAWNPSTTGRASTLEVSGHPDMREPFRFTVKEASIKLKQVYIGDNHWRVTYDQATWSTPATFTVIPGLVSNAQPTAVVPETKLAFKGEQLKASVKLVSPIEAAGFVAEASKDEKFTPGETRSFFSASNEVPLLFFRPGKYFYRFRAVNKAQELSSWSDPVVFDVTAPALDVPKLASEQKRVFVGETMQWQAPAPTSGKIMIELRTQDGTLIGSQEGNMLTAVADKPGTYMAQAKTVNEFGMASELSPPVSIEVAPKPIITRTVSQTETKEEKAQEKVEKKKVSKVKKTEKLAQQKEDKKDPIEKIQQAEKVKRETSAVGKTETKTEERPPSVNSNYNSTTLSMQGMLWTIQSSQQYHRNLQAPIALGAGLKAVKWFSNHGVEGMFKMGALGANQAGRETALRNFETRYHHRFFTPLPFTWSRELQITAFGGYEIYRNNAEFLTRRYDLFTFGTAMEFPVSQRWMMGGEFVFGFGTEGSQKQGISGHFNYFISPRWTLGAGYRLHMFNAGSAAFAGANVLPYREGYIESYSVLDYHF